eukprot:jgi/Phyca11/510059/fgenesh2_kg.PHYCAscaffold_53_\
MGAGDRLVMPRFLRETHRAPDVAPSSSSPSPASPSAGEAEPSMAEELQRRKAAFLAHFKSNSAPLPSSDDNAMATASDFSSTRSLDANMVPHTCADSKCHVCNAPLRLLRLRVGFMLIQGLTHGFY